ncbi:zwei Ig domain protein zig-8 isoform X2 [Andrena cerasifolii]|uniref:zwei Ig domain protein zig-8 isoform X2 n=1 Tax=Andrena cerasifolii TaxID=2819439 RepID=UPI004037E9D1
MSAISVAAWLLSAVAFAAINNGAHCYSMLQGSSGKNVNAHQNSLVDSGTTRTGPYFDLAASKNVTALLGKITFLNCRVKNMGNKTMSLQVSWVRHRDIHLLTIGGYTYTNDQRFKAIHNVHTDDWMLQIKYPQLRDSGFYECQVSTTPHMSHIVHLNVVEPKTEILGAPDLYINRGSTINLTCVVLQSPEPPSFIFWNHNDVIISYDSTRGGVSVVTEKGDSTTSFLLVQEAKPSDSGRYTCNPSNAQPKSITVHVLNGEYPAAMQHGGQAKQPRLYSLLLCLCLLLY